MTSNSLYLQEISGKECPSSLSYSRLYFWWKKSKVICNLVGCRLRNRKIRDILDLGCGRGDDIFALDSEFGNKFSLIFTGVDKDVGNIEFCEARKEFRGNENMRFCVGDTTELKSDDSIYDLVICSEVMEHVARPIEVLKEIKKVLKNDGVAIISTPNKTNPMIRLRKSLCFLKPLEAERKSRSNDGHISVSGLKTSIRIFKDEGFKVERICRGSLLFGGNQIDSPRFIFLVALLFDIILDFLPFAKNWSENIIFCLKKK